MRERDYRYVAHVDPEIGQMVRSLRIKSRATMQAFGELAGTTKSTVDKVERGLRNPSPTMIAGLFEAKGIHGAEMTAQRDTLLLKSAHQHINFVRAQQGKEPLDIPIDLPTLYQIKNSFDFLSTPRHLMLALRHEYNLMRQEFAQVTGLSTSIVQKIECGSRYADFSTIANICEGLKIPTDAPIWNYFLLVSAHDRIAREAKKIKVNN